MFKFIKHNLKHEKKNSNSLKIDSFKYSILISLHCNDIPNNPQRISNLNEYKSQYDLSAYMLNKTFSTKYWQSPKVKVPVNTK